MPQRAAGASPAKAVSVLVPTLNETTSLRQTVDSVVAETRGHLQEILILTSPRTTPATLAVAEALVRAHAPVVRIERQGRQGLGGAPQDGFERARGTHVLMMAADLETPPSLVPQLIAAASDDIDIVTASRWADGGGFVGRYARGQLALNWGFQQLFRGLYGTKLTDLTYGFRLFRKELVDAIAWQETSHRFLLETLLTPLRLGARVVEIPCEWRPRDEGTTDNTVWVKLAYVPLAVRTRMTPHARLRRHRREAA